MTIADTIHKGAVGLASAALVSFGGLVLSERTEQAVQTSQIESISQHQSETDQSLKHLNESLQSLDKSTAVIAERLQDTSRGKR